jgi:hypothetical protein
MLIMHDYFNAMASANAGLGSLGVGVYMLIWATFCVLGILYGIAAVYRIRRGAVGNAKFAWAGIGLGALPFMLLLLWFVPMMWDELVFRMQGPVLK